MSTIEKYRVFWFGLGVGLGYTMPLGIIYVITYLSGASTPEEGFAKSFLPLFLFTIIAVIGGGLSPILLKNWTGLALLAIGVNLPLSTFLAQGVYSGLSETHNILSLVYAVILAILLFSSFYSRINMRVSAKKPKRTLVKD